MTATDDSRVIASLAQDIPDLFSRPAIDAAARALYLNSPINAGRITDREGIWDRMPETTKDAHRRQAVAAITAALEADQ